MLRLMIAPNADLRCTAKDIMVDPYWSASMEPTHSHSMFLTSPTSFMTLISKMLHLSRTLSKRLHPICPPRHGHVQNYGYQLALVRTPHISISIIKEQR